jgi:hypothetical protein
MCIETGQLLTISPSVTFPNSDVSGWYYNGNGDEGHREWLRETPEYTIEEQAGLIMARQYRVTAFGIRSHLTGETEYVMVQYRK